MRSDKMSYNQELTIVEQLYYIVMYYIYKSRPILAL